MHAEQLMRDARYGYVIMMARDLRQVFFLRPDFTSAAGAAFSVLGCKARTRACNRVFSSI